MAFSNEGSEWVERNRKLVAGVWTTTSFNKSELFLSVSRSEAEGI
jgi:hypothetical protein